MKKSQTYPFTAIVGQDNMKEALILNTINPSIGGVLIRGEKGTAKSTSVRALADLLPERHVVEGCPCGCEWGNIGNMCPACTEKMENSELREAIVPMKVVELPLSSTEDRVAGTLDIEYAISTGKKKFEPGVLARANGNILYVDEVNLLDDHLVDLLLDAAAMGVNFIEREGVSYSHPSKFILIGTMNPEEGDLRPQLLDRFGMMVDVESERDENLRMAIVQRRMEFEKDPESFRDEYSKQQQELGDKIVRARSIVGDITPDAEVIRAAVRIALHLQVDGHRADLTLIKAAIAYAALENRKKVTSQDVLHVTNLVLPHRMRRNPFQDSSLNFEELDTWLRTTFKDQ